MKVFLFCLVLAIAGIGIFLGCRLLNSLKVINQLRKDRSDLIKEKSEQSDHLRLKEIEIDQLKKELGKYSEVEIKVALTSHEKQMILNALDSSQYKARVQDPKTRFFIRDTYRELKEKIKGSIKEE